MLRLERSRARPGACRSPTARASPAAAPAATACASRSPWTRTGRSRAARFGAAACAHATAAAAWACRRSEGRPFLDAARASLADCTQELGLDGRARECAGVALDALHAALGDAAERALALPLMPTAASRSRCRAASTPPWRCCASGPAAATSWASRCASGSTSRRRTPSAPAARPRPCCARARAVTRSGCRTSRWTAARPSAAPSSSRSWPAMRAARRPNPCTTCNGSYRLAALVGVAERLGAGQVATGHYARLVERDGRTLVARGADDAKDQSYMLARVPPARARAPAAAAGRRHQGRRAGRGGRRRPGRGHRAREPGRLLPRWRRARRLPRSARACSFSAGSIRDEAGHELGRHAGAAAYTPGQRRGLGLAAATPLYVLRSDAARNELVVGPREQPRLQRGRPARGAGGRRRDARARQAARPLAHGRRERRAAPGGLRLLLEEPVYGVAAGQTAALYDDAGCVVGSGVIAPPTRPPDRFLVASLQSVKGKSSSFGRLQPMRGARSASGAPSFPGQEKTETWPFPQN